MRRSKRILVSTGALILSLLVAAGSVFMIRRHKQDAHNRWNFDNMDAYLAQRQALDDEMNALKAEMQNLNATLKGTLSLLFDQCAPNAYEIVYAQLTEFDMVGSLVFRGVLPGDAGAITEAQWQEMQDKGWSAVLASNAELLATLEQSEYSQRLGAYVSDMKAAFEAKGFTVPCAYSFAQGEYSESTMQVLTEAGFTVFSAPDVQTGMMGEDRAIIQEVYLCSSPAAPLIQSTVDRVKNAADALVIKTRYVHEIEDLELDTELLKFRSGMLNTLSGYRNAQSVVIGSMAEALSAYSAQVRVQTELTARQQAVQTRMDAISKQLEELWNKYRKA